MRIAAGLQKGEFVGTDYHDAWLYNMGHLLTAACAHHRMTGKDSLLKIAIKTGDFLCDTFGVSVEPYFAHNPSAVMGLVELYRETGHHKYLQCAKLIVDRRGAEPKRFWGMFQMKPGVDGTDFIQDRVPLRRSTEIVGHNVFFTYQGAYSGLGTRRERQGERNVDSRGREVRRLCGNRAKVVGR